LGAILRAVLVDDPTPLRALLRRRRDELGMTVERAAADAGLRYNTLKSWEQGPTKDPPLRGVLRLARVLGISLDELAEAALSGEGSAARGFADDARGAREQVGEADRRARRRDTA
jgi:transcriptional regulator with XRE-family HTH domain